MSGASCQSSLVKGHVSCELMFVKYMKMANAPRTMRCRRFHKYGSCESNLCIKNQLCLISEASLCWLMQCRGSYLKRCISACILSRCRSIMCICQNVTFRSSPNYAIQSSSPILWAIVVLLLVIRIGLYGLYMILRLFVNVVNYVLLS